LLGHFYSLFYLFIIIYILLHINLLICFIFVYWIVYLVRLLTRLFTSVWVPPLDADPSGLRVNGYLLFTQVSLPKEEPQKKGGPQASKPSEWPDIESALLPRRKPSSAERKRSMVTCMAPPRRLAKREYCGDQFKKTLDLASTPSAFMETKGREELRALSNGNSSQKNTLLQTIENVDFSNKNSRQLTVQDQPKWQLYIFTGTQHREKFKELNGVYNTMSSKEEEKTMRSMKNTILVVSSTVQ